MLSCHIIKPLLDAPEMSFKHYFHSFWSYFLYNFVAQLYFCMQNSFQSFKCLGSIRKVCRLKRNSLKWPQTWMIVYTNITKRINTELMLYMRNFDNNSTIEYLNICGTLWTLYRPYQECEVKSTVSPRLSNGLQCLCERVILRRPVFSRWLCSSELLSELLRRRETSCPAPDNRAVANISLSDASHHTDNSKIHTLKPWNRALVLPLLHWLIWMGKCHFHMYYVLCFLSRENKTHTQIS